MGRWRVPSGVVLAALVAGCTMDPSAPLIPTPARPATIPPSAAPVRTADGFPNILADPVVVGGGLPRPQRAIDAEMDALAADRARAQAATRRIPRTNFAGDLSRQARDSVADARAEIAASGRANRAAAPAGPLPNAGDVVAQTRAEIEASGNRDDAAPAATPITAEPAPDAARPIDPAAPLPRAVGTVPSPPN